MYEVVVFIFNNYGRVRIEDYLYDSEVVKNFIAAHRWKNKNLLLIHMSAILNSVYNSNHDLRSPQISINLKKRVDFQQFLPGKSSKRTTTLLSNNEVLRLIQSHNDQKQHSPLHCFALLQLGLGIRFNNLEHLMSPKNHDIFYGSCDNCDFSGTLCGSVNADCMTKIKFRSSKVGAEITTYLIPQLHDCYYKISNLNGFSLKYGDYNNFLMATIGQNVRTHQLRKFLCNLCISHRNTGTWATEATMKNHYLAAHVQFFELYHLLLKDSILVEHT